MTATLSPLHWKETDPRCFGNLVPETGEFLGSVPDCGQAHSNFLKEPPRQAMLPRATAPKPPAWEVSRSN